MDKFAIFSCRSSSRTRRSLSDSLARPAAPVEAATSSQLEDRAATFPHLEARTVSSPSSRDPNFQLNEITPSSPGGQNCSCSSYRGRKSNWRTEPLPPPLLGGQNCFFSLSRGRSFQLGGQNCSIPPSLEARTVPSPSSRGCNFQLVVRIAPFFHLEARNVSALSSRGRTHSN